MFSVAFAVNAVGLVGMSALNARLLDRFDPRALLRTGVLRVVVGSALLVVDAVVGPHLWPTLILFWFTVSGLGLVFANATTLALAEVRAAAGTGSAVLGASQFALGAVVAPVVGLGGEGTAVPMAVTMLASACIAAVALKGHPSAAGLTYRRGVTTTALRVLHERPGVREATLLQVQQAIRDLDKQRSQLRLSGRKYLFDVVMQAPGAVWQRFPRGRGGRITRARTGGRAYAVPLPGDGSVPAMVETLDRIRTRGPHGCYRQRARHR